MARYGVGASLASLGTSQENDAFNLLGEAAKDESMRNQTNTKIEADRKAGNKQLGATAGGLAGGAIAGATYGSAAGPWGSLIGGLVGAVAGGLFN